MVMNLLLREIASFVCVAFTTAIISFAVFVIIVGARRRLPFRCLCVCVCFPSNAIKTYFPVDEKNVSALAFALAVWQASRHRSPEIHCNQIWARRDGKCFPLGNEIASCFWGVPLVSASTRKTQHTSKTPLLEQSARRTENKQSCHVRKYYCKRCCLSCKRNYLRGGRRLSAITPTTDIHTKWMAVNLSKHETARIAVGRTRKIFTQFKCIVIPLPCSQQFRKSFQFWCVRRVFASMRERAPIEIYNFAPGQWDTTAT